MLSLTASPGLPKGTLPYSAERVQLRELTGMAKVRVQALRERGAKTPAADPARLPVRPNTISGADPIAMWKAPDDWLVCSQTLGPDALMEWVAATASEAPLVATDVTSAHIVLELSGADAVEVLMRDCCLDLDGDGVPPGHCAQTQFAQTNVMLHHCTSPECWRLFVEHSVALHVWNWLLDSANVVGGAQD